MNLLSDRIRQLESAIRELATKTRQGTRANSPGDQAKLAQFEQDSDDLVDIASNLLSMASNIATTSGLTASSASTERPATSDGGVTSGQATPRASSPDFSESEEDNHVTFSESGVPLSLWKEGTIQAWYGHVERAAGTAGSEKTPFSTGSNDSHPEDSKSGAISNHPMCAKTRQLLEAEQFGNAIRHVQRCLNNIPEHDSRTEYLLPFILRTLLLEAYVMSCDQRIKSQSYQLVVVRAKKGLKILEELRKCESFTESSEEINLRLSLGNALASLSSDYESSQEAETILISIVRSEGIGDLNRLKANHLLGKMYLDISRFVDETHLTTAKRYLTKAARGRTSLCGSDHPDTIDSVTLLVAVLKILQDENAPTWEKLLPTCDLPLSDMRRFIKFVSWLNKTTTRLVTDKSDEALRASAKFLLKTYQWQLKKSVCWKCVLLRTGPSSNLFLNKTGTGKTYMHQIFLNKIGIGKTYSHQTSCTESPNCYAFWTELNLIEYLAGCRVTGDRGRECALEILYLCGRGYITQNRHLSGWPDREVCYDELFFATCADNLKSCELLCRSSNQFRRTTFHFVQAMRWNRRGVVRLLLKHGVKLKEGAYEKSIFHSGNLMYDLNLEELEFVLKELPARAKSRIINHKDWEQNTPLNALLLSDEVNLESIKLLLRAGADPNIADEGGETPLHRAILSCQQKAVDIIPLLIEYGADVNHVLPKKGRALDYCKDDAIRETLKDNGGVRSGPWGIMKVILNRREARDFWGREDYKSTSESESSDS